MQDDKMLTFAEAGRRMGLCNHMIVDLVSLGVLHAFRPAPGKPRRIWESELIRYRQSTLQKKNDRERLEDLERSQAR